MTTSDPERPPQPFGGTEYPSLENPAPQPDPYPPVDYPADAGLPPPSTRRRIPVRWVTPAIRATTRAVRPVPAQPSHPARTARRSRRLSRRWWDCFVAACRRSSGLILGVIAMRETKRTGQDGYAMALIGAIIGGLAVAGWVLYLLLSIGIYASGWQWAP